MFTFNFLPFLLFFISFQNDIGLSNAEDDKYVGDYSYHEYQRKFLYHPTT